MKKFIIGLFCSALFFVQNSYAGYDNRTCERKQKFCYSIGSYTSYAGYAAMTQSEFGKPIPEGSIQSYSNIDPPQERCIYNVWYYENGWRSAGTSSLYYIKTAQNEYENTTYPFPLPSGQCCGDGQEWVPVTQSCEDECPSGWDRDEFGQCQPDCPEGYHVGPDNLCAPDNPCPDAEAACTAQCGDLKPSFSCLQIDGQYATSCECVYDPDYVPPDELPPLADPTPFEPMPIPDPAGEEGSGPDESPEDTGNGSNPYDDPDDEPEDTPSESPDGEPTTEEQSKWLQPIKENLDKLLGQAQENNTANEIISQNQVVMSGKLSDINSGVSQITKNQVVLSNQQSSIISGINTTNEGIGVLSNQLDRIGDQMERGLDVNMPDSLTVQGNQGTLPADNNYDSAVEELEPDGFFELVNNYMGDNYPVLNFINGSGFEVAGANPVISTEIYGNSITIDASEYEDIWHYMGLVLLAISGLISFRIVVRG